jgi:hypothetical protein
VHSFTSPEAGKNHNPMMAYNPLADKRSWAAMRELIAEVCN